jgi:maleate isomerase
MNRRKFLSALGLGSGTLLSVPTIAKTAGSDRNAWQPDGAGTVARFGVLTPDFDPVPESEMWAMVPRGISIHAARVARNGPPGAGFVEPPYVDDAVDRLVELAPRAILLGYTSSSYALGADVDDRVHARLEQRAKGIPVIFTCSAATAALRDLNVRRISVVHPPWWSDKANDEGTVYWRAAGFDVLECTRIQPARSRTEVPAAEVFEFVSAHTPHAAEAVFIGGNGLRAVGAIRALEARLGRPVLTANHVAFWYTLRQAGVGAPVNGYGRVFRKLNPEGRSSQD